MKNKRENQIFNRLRHIAQCAFVALSFAAASSEISAQSTTAPPTTNNGGQTNSSGQGDGGQRQEQDRQRRRRQQQQEQQQQPNQTPNGNITAPNNQSNESSPTRRPNQDSPQNSSPQQQQNQSPVNSPNGTGIVGEPAGATTPRAPINNGVQLPNTEINSTGAARVLAVAPANLTLAEAVRIGIDNNLSTLLAAERIEAARGTLQQSRSFLLPNLNGAGFQQNRTLNLAAQGLSAGGEMMVGGMMSAPPIPSFVGPFNTFDARFNFSQTILNLASYREYKSGKRAVRLAELNVELAREQVAVFVALAYLSVQRSEMEIDAARADLILAETLFKVAVDQRDVGIASGVDVVRSETRVVQERLRFIQAEANLEQTRLDFERVVGLPLGSRTVLIDMLMARGDAVPNLDTSLDTARQTRFEIQVADELLGQREQTRRARVAELYPTLDAFGDYGLSGNTPTENSRATRNIGVRVNVPIYDGGFTRGRIKVAESEKRQAELQLGNTRGQVEEEVRVALVSLRLTNAQVAASDEQFRLATLELDLAVVRFRAGVADNAEVVRAQAGLANARALKIQALAQYNAARLNFAAAVGRAQDFTL